MKHSEIKPKTSIYLAKTEATELTRCSFGEFIWEQFKIQLLVLKLRGDPTTLASSSIAPLTEWLSSMLSDALANSILKHLFKWFRRKAQNAMQQEMKVSNYQQAHEWRLENLTDKSICSYLLVKTRNTNIRITGAIQSFNHLPWQWMIALNKLYLTFLIKRIQKIS